MRSEWAGGQWVCAAMNWQPLLRRRTHAGPPLTLLPPCPWPWPVPSLPFQERRIAEQQAELGELRRDTDHMRNSAALNQTAADEVDWGAGGGGGPNHPDVPHVHTRQAEVRGASTRLCCRWCSPMPCSSEPMGTTPPPPPRDDAATTILPCRATCARRDARTHTHALHAVQALGAHTT